LSGIKNKNLEKHRVFFDEAKTIFMKIEDDLRPEYDFKNLTVRKLGSGRKSFGGATVRLEPDVAAVFPNADAVNEALRFMIRVMQQNQSTNLAVLTEVQKQ